MTHAPLLLRPLRLEDEEEAVRAHEEMAADGFGFLLMRDQAGSWEQYVAWLEEVRHGRSLRGRMVGSTFLVAELDGALVGRASVRHELNEWLATWGGHVGYGVRPAYRRRGVATAILRHCLDLCAELGIEEALVTTDVDNHASQAVVHRCGGFPDPELPLVAAGPDVAAKKRFLVPTST